MARLENGQIKKHFVDFNGQRKAVWFWRDGDDMLLVFAGSDDVRYVADDQNTYMFTHGGELYKAACRRFWELYR